MFMRQPSKKCLNRIEACSYISKNIWMGLQRLLQVVLRYAFTYGIWLLYLWEWKGPVCNGFVWNGIQEPMPHFLVCLVCILLQVCVFSKLQLYCWHILVSINTENIAKSVGYLTMKKGMLKFHHVDLYGIVNIWEDQ